MIYKNRDIEAVINERGVNLGNIDVVFYTKDINTTSFRLFLKKKIEYANETFYDIFDLRNKGLTPYIDLMMEDGSIFTREPMEIVEADAGLIQYNIPSGILLHVGKVEASVYLLSDTNKEDEGVEVAQFYFYIDDDGLTSRVRRVVNTHIVDEAVARVLSQDAQKLLDSRYKTNLENSLRSYLFENADRFKGPKGDEGDKGDVGPEGPIAPIEKLYLYNKLNGMFSNYEVPNELKINVPFTIQTNKNGETKFSYDVSTKKNSVTKTYYVDIKTGNNANAGTQEDPFKSINRALRYGDADEIVVNEGVYGWSDGFSGYSQTKPFNLIGKGTVIIGAHRDKLTWTKNSTYSNVYQTTATSVNEVVDFKNTNDIRILTKQSSLQAVSENIGSFYIDTNNNIYVRTHDDRTPDEKIFPNMISDGVKLTDNPKIYFENVTFSNTVRLTATTTNKQFYAKNCQFLIGTGNNALSIEGYDYNILQNCTASYGTMDGFNYHVGNGILPKVIEIDCKGYNNGRNGADQNNGSTMHDGGHILRIGGEYYGNSGPNVIDVNEGTMSVNLGVYSHNSNATKGTVSNTCFKNGNIGASKMYLINCLSNGSDYSVVTATSQGSSTVIDNSLLMENQTTV